MRRAWNLALSQARFRRRRRWGVFGPLAVTFPLPYNSVQGKFGRRVFRHGWTRSCVVNLMRMTWSYVLVYALCVAYISAIPVLETRSAAMEPQRLETAEDMALREEATIEELETSLRTSALGTSEETEAGGPEEQIAGTGVEFSCTAFSLIV